MPNRGRITREVWLVVRSAGYTRGIRAAILSSAALRVAWTGLNVVANRLTSSMSKQSNVMTKKFTGSVRQARLEMDLFGDVKNKAARKAIAAKDAEEEFSKTAVGGMKTMRTEFARSRKAGDGFFTSLRNGFNKASENVTNFGGKIASLGAKLATGIFAAGVAAAAAGITAIATATLKLRVRAQEVEEQFASFNFTFKEHSIFLDQAIAGWGGLANKMGLTQTQARKQLASFGAMLQSMGVATDKAADMSLEFFKLAGDLGSIRNIEPEKVMEKFQSALAKMPRPLRKLGINLDELTLQTFGWERSMTRAQFAAIVLEASIAQMGDTGALGDLDRTIGSVANSWRRLRAMFEQIKDVISTAALPAIKSFIDFFEPKLKEMGIGAEDFGNKFGQILMANMQLFLGLVRQTLPWLESMASVLGFLGNVSLKSSEEMLELSKVTEVNIDRLRGNKEATDEALSALNGMAEGAEEAAEKLRGQAEAMRESEDVSEEIAENVEDLANRYEDLIPRIVQAHASLAGGDITTAEEQIKKLNNEIIVAEATATSYGVSTDLATQKLKEQRDHLQRHVDMQTRANKKVDEAKEALDLWDEGFVNLSEGGMMTVGEWITNFPRAILNVIKGIVDFVKGVTAAVAVVGGAVGKVVNEIEIATHEADLAIKEWAQDNKYIPDFLEPTSEEIDSVSNAIERNKTELADQEARLDENIDALDRYGQGVADNLGEGGMLLSGIADRTVLEGRYDRALGELNQVGGGMLDLLIDTENLGEAGEDAGNAITDAAEGVTSKIGGLRKEVDKTAKSIADMVAEVAQMGAEDGIESMGMAELASELEESATNLGTLGQKMRNLGERAKSLEAMAEMPGLNAEQLGAVNEALSRTEEEATAVFEAIESGEKTSKALQERLEELQVARLEKRKEALTVLREISREEELSAMSLEEANAALDDSEKTVEDLRKELMGLHAAGADALSDEDITRIAEIQRLLNAEVETQKELEERIKAIFKEQADELEGQREILEDAVNAFDEMARLSDDIGLGGVGDVFGGLGDLTSGIGDLAEGDGIFGGALGDIGETIGSVLGPVQDALGALPGIGQAVSGAVSAITGLVDMFAGKSFAEKFGDAVDRFDTAVSIMGEEGVAAMERMLQTLRLEGLDEPADWLENAMGEFDLDTVEGVEAFKEMLQGEFELASEGGPLDNDAFRRAFEAKDSEAEKQAFLDTVDRFIQLSDEQIRIIEDEIARDEGEGQGETQAERELHAIRTITEFQASEMLGYLQDANRIARSNKEYNKITSRILSNMADSGESLSHNVLSSRKVPVPPGHLNANMRTDANGNLIDARSSFANGNTKGGSTRHGGSLVNARSSARNGNTFVINLDGSMSPAKQADSVRKALLDILSDRSTTRRAGRSYR